MMSHQLNYDYRLRYDSHCPGLGLDLVKHCTHLNLSLDLCFDLSGLRQFLLKLWWSFYPVFHLAACKSCRAETLSVVFATSSHSSWWF